MEGVLCFSHVQSIVQNKIRIQPFLYFTIIISGRCVTKYNTVLSVTQFLYCNPPFWDPTLSLYRDTNNTC